MLTNQTPLPALVRPHRDHLRASWQLVIAKGTWRLSSGRLAPAELQVGLHQHQVNLCLGELALDPVQAEALKPRLDEQIVWLDHDLAPPKPAFDVIVAGYATAPPGHAALFVDAGVRIGAHTAGMRAFAPRCWQRGWLGYRAQALADTVRRVPVSYALADWPSGFAVDTAPDRHPACLPWIEAPHSPSERRHHSGTPAGLGFWPENAAHRARHGGTYDPAWQTTRAPDLPADFNPRFYNAAHPDLQLKHAPAPGSAIRLVHLAPQAIVDAAFPALSLAVQARTASGRVHAALAMQPDTLILEPDHDRLSVVWRALVPAGEQGEAVRSIRLFKT